jgi:hypothetical protein
MPVPNRCSKVATRRHAARSPVRISSPRALGLTLQPPRSLPQGALRLRSQNGAPRGFLPLTLKLGRARADGRGERPLPMVIGRAWGLSTRAGGSLRVNGKRAAHRLPIHRSLSQSDLDTPAPGRFDRHGERRDVEVGEVSPGGCSKPPLRAGARLSLWPPRLLPWGRFAHTWRPTGCPSDSVHERIRPPPDPARRCRRLLEPRQGQLGYRRDMGRGSRPTIRWRNDRQRKKRERERRKLAARAAPSGRPRR